MDTGPLHVVGFSGSLREGSFNSMLLRAAAELAPPDLRVSIYDLADLPLFKGSFEARGDPPSVARFMGTIRAADGILMVTPEYSHGMSGVMKNAVDWASRPRVRSVLHRKPVAVMGASMDLTGTSRAQSQLRQSLEFTNSWCMAEPKLSICNADERFGWSGTLKDESVRTRLAHFMTSFRDWVRLLLPVSNLANQHNEIAGPGKLGDLRRNHGRRS